MAPVRLVTAVVPTILSDIVRALTAERADLELVAQVGRESDLLTVTDQYQPDVVITSVDSSSSETDWECLLISNPRLRLLTISDDGREVHLLRLIPDRIVIHDVSTHELLDAILGTGRYEQRRIGES